MSTIIFFACWRWWLKNNIPTRYVPKTGLVSQFDKNVFMLFRKENWILKFYIWLKLFWQNLAETYRNVQVFWFDKRYKAWMFAWMITRTIRLKTIIFSIAKEMWFSYVNRTSNRTHYIFFIHHNADFFAFCMSVLVLIHVPNEEMMIRLLAILMQLSWLQDYEVILDISPNLFII